MTRRYTDVTKYKDLRPAAEQILLEQVQTITDWSYSTSKSSFVYRVSKNTNVEISTGLSPKSTYVNFQFAIRVTNKLVKKVSESLGHRKPFSDLVVVWGRERFIPDELGRGSLTVYLPNTSDLFDAENSKGNNRYVRLADFPERLAAIFELSESEINRLFDLSSEEALIRSIASHPIGTFRATDILMIKLMLGEGDYYDELLTFYDQPAETLWKEVERGFVINQGFQREVGEAMTAIYRSGNFPKFDFS